MKRLAILFGFFALYGCDGCGGGSFKPPGDQSMGSYSAHWQGISKNCGIPVFPETIDTTLILSRRSDGGGVFLTESNGSQSQTSDAGFDGQLFTAASVSPGQYGWEDGGSCDDCTSLTVVSNYTFALVSKTQSSALLEMCPTNPLDGGVPGPDEDAGITGPVAFDDGGFDSVRICGQVVINITGTGFSCAPVCQQCVLTYTLTGQRQ